jgi:hypothetical protein
MVEAEAIGGDDLTDTVFYTQQFQHMPSEHTGKAQLKFNNADSLASSLYLTTNDMFGDPENDKPMIQTCIWDMALANLTVKGGDVYKVMKKAVKLYENGEKAYDVAVDLTETFPGIEGTTFGDVLGKVGKFFENVKSWGCIEGWDTESDIGVSEQIIY